jgi:4'-phosphopantetheinyl transferase
MPSFSDLEREVHLWFLPTAMFDELNLAPLAGEVLSDEEQLRAGRFAFERDRRTYITAHWLLRRVLSLYLPVATQAWEFQHTLHGKPAIRSPGEAVPMRFNLSHSRGMAACAVTCLGEVGVDVETVHDRDYLRLARRFFAPQETSQLESLPIEQQPSAFFRLWTLKEAYIKARGLGLSIDLASFAFPQVMRDEIRIQFAEGFEDDPADWRFFRHEPDGEHKIAAAVHCPPDRDVAWKIFPEIASFLP